MLGFRKTFNKNKKSVRGFSLMEAMIAMGVMAGGALMFAQFASWQNKTNHYNAFVASRDELYNYLQRTMRDDQAISATMNHPDNGGAGNMSDMYTKCATTDSSLDCISSTGLTTPRLFALYSRSNDKIGSQVANAPVRYTVEGVKCTAAQVAACTTVNPTDCQCPLIVETSWSVTCPSVRVNTERAPVNSPPPVFQGGFLEEIYQGVVPDANAQVFGQWVEQNPCKTAWHFVLRATVRQDTNVKVAGGTNLPARTYERYLIQSGASATGTLGDNFCDYENGEVQIGVKADGSPKCGKMPLQKTVIARHSQLNGADIGCYFGSGQNFKMLRRGVSYMGSWSNNASGNPQDLGSPGSCINAVTTNAVNPDLPELPIKPPNLFMETHKDTGDFAMGDFGSGGDYNMFLMGMDSGLVPRPLASRCAVCEVPGPVYTVHSFLATPPACPAGWSALWEGYSFGSASMEAGGSDEGYNSGQDLASPGSCLPFYVAMPIIECNASGNNDWGECRHKTDYDEAIWLTNGNTGVGRCTVCYQPHKLTATN